MLSLNDYKMLLSVSIRLSRRTLDITMQLHSSVQLTIRYSCSNWKLVAASKRSRKYTCPISRWNHETRSERTKKETLLHQVKLLRYVITILHKRSTSGWLYAAIAQRSPIHLRTARARHWRSLARQPLRSASTSSSRDAVWSIIKMPRLIENALIYYP